MGINHTVTSNSVLPPEQQPKAGMSPTWGTNCFASSLASMRYTQASTLVLRPKYSW